MKNAGSNLENAYKIKNSSLHKQSSCEEKDEMNTNWWLFFGLIVILTAGTRFYKVTEPQHVCWDETHFGKMGSWYINRTFFFDVHPPLGKMLIGLSGYLTGYDGTFAFEKPGDKYENVKYVGMRLFCTFLGATIVPLSYLIVWDLTKSIQAAAFSALFVLFDIGLLTLNQYILLDPILLCFVMCATWGMARMGSLRNEPFTWKWWGWLTFTGISLACTISVKFVGLFVVLLVGLYTAFELWRELGDLTKPITYVGKHLLARCICLVLLPIVLYMLFFYIHLSVLNKSGSGDGFYSSEFQSLLEGNSLYNATMPRQLAYGATITLKNHRTGGGYLHSHWHLYPEGVGARQQQNGTGDANDVWKVLIMNGRDGDAIETVTSKLKFVHYLHHCVLTCSGKTLPKWAYSQQEVSCNPNMRDKNARWNIEDNNYAKLPNVSFQVYAPGFLNRFFESHAVMLQGNSDLKVKEGEVSSRPWQWPINYRGQFFSGNNLRIYLLGNPVIWWGNIIFLILFVVLYIHACVREKRGCTDQPAILIQRNKILCAGKWLFLGWVLHYAPFWAMNRVLYFHHYFPALLYSSMLTGTTLNYIIETLNILFPNSIGRMIYHTILVFVISSTVYSFYLFSPLAYGMVGLSAQDPESPMHSLRWMDTWEF
ncbi:protein O-mannosyl-transferase 2 isoform X2 [Megalopta genalis]|uniref:protein O-mannosyl-transferase 2 isoform X2 n=1 Tax=Megalopta genalis TaxID=115081 RepID=UPI003FCF204B